jgi:hypothetical protein
MTMIPALVFFTAVLQILVVGPLAIRLSDVRRRRDAFLVAMAAGMGTTLVPAGFLQLMFWGLSHGQPPPSIVAIIIGAWITGGLVVGIVALPYIVSEPWDGPSVLQEQWRWPR